MSMNGICVFVCMFVWRIVFHKRKNGHVTITGEARLDPKIKEFAYFFAV